MTETSVVQARRVRLLLPYVKISEHKNSLADAKAHT